jgi:hypothetical protein
VRYPRLGNQSYINLSVLVVVVPGFVPQMGLLARHSGLPHGPSRNFALSMAQDASFWHGGVSPLNSKIRVSSDGAGNKTEALIYWLDGTQYVETHFRLISTLTLLVDSAVIYHEGFIYPHRCGLCAGYFCPHDLRPAQWKPGWLWHPRPIIRRSLLTCHKLGTQISDDLLADPRCDFQRHSLQWRPQPNDCVQRRHYRRGRLTSQAHMAPHPDVRLQ